MRTDCFTVVANRDFDAVLAGCAEARPGRAHTWINARIRRLYRGLFEIGHCHSIEVYDGDALVGGLYGVSIGGLFAGESMFHRDRDASKVALLGLVELLRDEHADEDRETAEARCRHHVQVAFAGLRDGAHARGDPGCQRCQDERHDGGHNERQ